MPKLNSAAMAASGCGCVFVSMSRCVFIFFMGSSVLRAFLVVLCGGKSWGTPFHDNVTGACGGVRCLAVIFGSACWCVRGAPRDREARCLAICWVAGVVFVSDD